MNHFFGALLLVIVVSKPPISLPVIDFLAALLPFFCNCICSILQQWADFSFNFKQQQNLAHSQICMSVVNVGTVFHPSLRAEKNYAATRISVIKWYEWFSQICSCCETFCCRLTFTTTSAKKRTTNKQFNNLSPHSTKLFLQSNFLFFCTQSLWENGPAGKR